MVFLVNITVLNVSAARTLENDLVVYLLTVVFLFYLLYVLLPSWPGFS